VERSITAEQRLVAELEAVFTAAAARRGAADGQLAGVGFLSAATVLRGQGRVDLHAARDNLS
jgi:hypothetical protein